ncbi:MAG: STAS domain-containing protein [Umezawaea sp.]
MSTALPTTPAIHHLSTGHRPSSATTSPILRVDVRLAQPGTVVLTAVGGIDLSSAPHLLDRLREELHHAGPDLVLDLSGVTFFGATALAVLAEFSAATRAAGVEFRVVAHTHAVLKLLAITGMTTMFGVHPDLDSAPMRPWLPIGRR